MNFHILEHINVKMKYINVDISVYNVAIFVLRKKAIMDYINVFMEV